MLFLLHPVEGCAILLIMEGEMTVQTVQDVWALLQAHAGETFYTSKGLPFCYQIRGGELFVDRRSKSITISTVANALVRIQEREAAGELITGPKKIGCYGASYLYPVFLQLGIIHLPPDGQLNFYSL